MRFLEHLQQKVGFTHKEAIAILTLSATFLAGLGIRWFQSSHNDQAQPSRQFDYSRMDSAYAARAQGSSQQPTTKQSILPSPLSASSSKILKQRTLLSTHGININAAMKSELMNLPGIGASFAERIILYRQQHGDFSSVDELARVKGIGEKKLAQLRPFVRVK